MKNEEKKLPKLIHDHDEFDLDAYFEDYFRFQQSLIDQVNKTLEKPKKHIPREFVKKNKIDQE